MIVLLRILIFFANLLITTLSICFSISLFTSFIISSLTASRTVMKYGIKSTLTSFQVSLYLHALWTSFLNFQIAHLANTSINGQVRVYGLNIEGNDKFIVTFRVKVKDTVNQGDKIINIAKLDAEKQDDAIVIIGATSGSSSIYGYLSYLNKDSEKVALKNYTITITEIKKAGELLTYSTKSDEDGKFEINNVKPAE